MPKSATLSSAVETATKCRATASCSSWPASPSSSQALQSRALVSVSRVPKVLLDTMNSVVAGSRPVERGRGVGRVDVADEPALEPGLAVGLQRLVGHHRTEVGAADADVDDGADPLAGDAGPRAGADPVGEVVDPAQHLVDVLRRRPVRPPRGSASSGSRSAVCRTARSSVTLMCSPRNIASRRAGDADLLGQGQQRGEDAAVTSSLDRSTWRSAAVNVSALARSGSSANHARRSGGEPVGERAQRVPGRPSWSGRRARRSLAPAPSASGRSRPARSRTS